jgi:hypothetical protein
MYVYNVVQYVYCTRTCSVPSYESTKVPSKVQYESTKVLSKVQYTIYLRSYFHFRTLYEICSGLISEDEA